MPVDNSNSFPSRTSRELSDRIDYGFHREGNPARRRLGWWSLAAFGIIAGWLVVAAVLRQRTIYEAGPVAPPHQLFESNCAACHTTWAPPTRLVSFSGSVSSVDDQKCQACHAGAAHFAGQDPPHEGLGCAACHREHRGDPTLVVAADQRCVECHGALESHLAKLTKGSAEHSTPAVKITSFAGDHPEFAALASRDKAQIAFNHSLHLVNERDASGKLIKGIVNERGELEDLAHNCAACHELDASRRFMKPISFDQHCQRCHQLHFDSTNFPNETIPHGQPASVVRGFLTEKFTELALKDPSLLEAPQVVRPLPGHSTPTERLTPAGRRRVREQAASADQRIVAPIAASEEEARDAAIDRQTVLFGKDALGGCRLCHMVDNAKTAGAKSADGAAGDAPGFAADWTVAPPNIPARWMSEARFSHDSHRFVACTDCHRDLSVDPPRPVTESRLTSDVLMPSIADCRKCHGDATGGLIAGTQAQAAAASRCIDCHDYHDRALEDQNRSLTFALPGSDASYLSPRRDPWSLTFALPASHPSGKDDAAAPTGL